MKLKYIMLDHDMPIIFGDLVSHRDMAIYTGREGQVTGAGFVCQDASGNWIAYDESVSLKLKPGPNDSKVLHAFLSGQI